MKTLINKITNESVYLFNDDAEVELRDSCLYLNGILDVEGVDSNTYILVSDVTPPDDWIGNKYLLVEDDLNNWQLKEEE
jgi:hypothetical protein